jgi:hypothetical protein
MNTTTTNTYIIPLSLTTRFLATQLSTPTSKPHILLPKPLIKSFLTENSTITYRNEISSLNPFQKKYTFQLSSTKYLERISRSFNVVSTPLKSYTSYNPISLIIPASQINPILNPKFQETAFCPPPNSDIFIVNPYFGQIEKYISSISSNYSISERPRIWSIISTHLLFNTPSWGVEHHSIGEIKISNVPFDLNDLNISNNNNNNNNQDIIQLIKKSTTLQQILNSSTLLPQLEPYLNSTMLLAEQLIIEAAFSPLLYPTAISSIELLSLSTPENEFNIKSQLEFKSENENKIKLKTTILEIIQESINVLKKSPIFNKFSRETPVFNAILSQERLFNLVLNILYNNKIITNLQSHINSYKNLVKMKQRILLDSMDVEDKFFKINRLRNPSRANKFICQEGLKYNVATSTNKLICEKFSSEEFMNYYNDIDNYEDDNDKFIQGIEIKS